MNNILDQFCGKEIYGCRFLGTRLNMNPDTFSLCHEAQVGDRVLGKIKNLSPERYYEALKMLIERNVDKDAPCRKCDKVEKYIYRFTPINYVTINTSVYCNSSCVYCQGHFGEKNTGYNPIPYLKNFDSENLFAKGCYFDWGGGEPTLNPWFEETIEWIEQHGYWQRINTNAILYSEATESALIRGKAEVRISVDSGSERCFQFMKGHTEYNKVWKHIEDYCRANDKVYIKYNICNYNSDLEEIEIFVQKCKVCGVKHIIIDAEVNSYQPCKNAGPFYFTRKEFDAAHYLEQLAKRKGFDVQISGYAFSVRAEFDEKNNFRLPKMYYDNLDYEVCSHSILLQTFPSVNYMIKHIKKCNRPLVIWGGRDFGKKVIHILKAQGIKIDSIIDNDPSLQNEQVCGLTVKSVKDYFLKKSDSQIILAGKRWKEMLSEINEYQYENAGVYYLPDCYYYNYDMSKSEK